MPSVSCGCCVPSFLYRLYRATRRRAEASPRACVASSCARGDGIRIIHHYGTAIEVFAKLIRPVSDAPGFRAANALLRLTRWRFEYLPRSDSRYNYCATRCSSRSPEYGP